MAQAGVCSAGVDQAADAQLSPSPRVSPPAALKPKDNPAAYDLLLAWRVVCCLMTRQAHAAAGVVTAQSQAQVAMMEADGRGQVMGSKESQRSHHRERHRPERANNLSFTFV